MSYKILIADDEINIARHMEDYLNTLPDVEVAAVATDGKSAYEEAKRHRPEIIITDICMPEMTGLEFLQRLREDGMKAKILVISGYDEFDYVRQAMSYGVKEYLLKPFSPEELSEQVEKLVGELDQEKQLEQNLEFLKQRSDRSDKLISGYLLEDILGRKCRDISQIDQLQRQSFPFEAKAFCVCMARVNFYRQDSKWNFSFRDSLEEFTVLFDKKIFGSAIMFFAVPAGNDCFALVFANTVRNRGFREELVTGLNHLANSMKKYYGFLIYFAMGNICENWEKLPDSYEEALYVFKTLVLSDACVYSYNDEQGRTEKPADMSEEIRLIRDGILMNVKMGNEAEAKEQLELLLKKYVMLPSQKSDFMMISLAEMVYEINCFLEKKKYINSIGDQKNLNSFYNDINSRIQFGNYMEIRALLEQYISECSRLVAMYLSKNRTDKLSEQLKYIIQTNLDNEELNIDMVADMVNLRPNYVRQVFREKVGEGFVDYVVRHRMEKAVKLLSGTDLKVQEIAASCGYGNQQYFASSFKKAYGCTPTAYKKRCAEGKEERQWQFLKKPEK